MKTRRLFLFGFLMGACTTIVTAQINESSMISATSTERSISNYYFAKPNELTIIVSVLGFVQRPGRYEVSRTIDLINLMALAGGATPEGQMDDVKITRASEVDGRIRMSELHINLEKVAKLTSDDLRLLPGDIIQVDRSGWAGFKDAITVIVGAADITTAVAEVMIAKKY
jgi:protein involved in polysaccharide export with SLBB domain